MCYPKSVRVHCPASILASVTRRRSRGWKSNVSGSDRTIPLQEMVWCSCRRRDNEGRTPMAQPIPLEVPPRNPRAELHARLLNAPEEHAEAVLAAYEVLQE